MGGPKDGQESEEECQGGEGGGEVGFPRSGVARLLGGEPHHTPLFMEANAADKAVRVKLVLRLQHRASGATGTGPSVEIQRADLKALLALASTSPLYPASPLHEPAGQEVSAPAPTPQPASYGNSDSTGTLSERLRAASLGDYESRESLAALLVEASQAIDGLTGDGVAGLTDRLLSGVAPSDRDKVLAAAVASLEELRRHQNEGLTAYERYMEIEREARADRCDRVDRDVTPLNERAASDCGPEVLAQVLAQERAPQVANELVDGLARFDARRRYLTIVDRLRAMRAAADWKPENDRVFLIALENLFAAMSPEDQKIANAESWRNWRAPQAAAVAAEPLSAPQTAAPAKCQHDFHIVGTNSVCRFCDLLEHYFRLHEKEVLESLPLRLRHAAAGTGGYGPSDLAALLEEAAQVIAAQPGVAAEGEPMHSINMSVLDLEDAIQTWVGERYGFHDGFWKATVKTPDEHEFVVAWELEDVPPEKEDDASDGKEDVSDEEETKWQEWESLTEAHDDAQRRLLDAVLVEDAEWNAKDAQGEAAKHAHQFSLRNARKRALLAFREALRALNECERSMADEGAEQP